MHASTQYFIKLTKITTLIDETSNVTVYFGLTIKLLPYQKSSNCIFSLYNLQVTKLNLPLNRNTFTHSFTGR